MILGVASRLPVVAAVATEDRHGTFVRCPYCYEIHCHGGFGPGSPRGAADGGRYSHCMHASGMPGHSDHVIDLHDAGVLPRLYAIKEVPGRAWEEWVRGPDGYEIRIRHLEYDYAAMENMRPEIDAMILAYEAERGSGRRGRVGFGPRRDPATRQALRRLSAL